MESCAAADFISFYNFIVTFPVIKYSLENLSFFYHNFRI